MKLSSAMIWLTLPYTFFSRASVQQVSWMLSIVLRAEYLHGHWNKVRPP